MRFFDQVHKLPRTKTRAELDAHYEKMDMEKGDMLALIIAGFVTFVPILIGIGLVMLLIMKFFRAI